LIVKHVVTPNVSANHYGYLHLIFENNLAQILIDRSIILLGSDVK